MYGALCLCNGGFDQMLNSKFPNLPTKAQIRIHSDLSYTGLHVCTHLWTPFCVPAAVDGVSGIREQLVT